MLLPLIVIFHVSVALALLQKYLLKIEYLWV